VAFAVVEEACTWSGHLVGRTRTVLKARRMSQTTRDHQMFPAMTTSRQAKTIYYHSPYEEADGDGSLEHEDETYDDDSGEIEGDDWDHYNEQDEHFDNSNLSYSIRLASTFTAPCIVPFELEKFILKTELIQADSACPSQ
jgi:hypothetical protein